MDPDTALKELLDALECRDWSRVDESSEALLDWMQGSGFPPVTVGPKTLGVQWHRTIATFVCHAAKARANDARKRRQRKRGARCFITAASGASVPSHRPKNSPRN